MNKADNEVYDSLFSPDRSERQSLGALIKNVHRELKRYRGFTPSPYGDDIEKDLAFYKMRNKHEGGRVFNLITPWQMNPFYAAEELVLYSGNAQELEPLTIAAISSQDQRGRYEYSSSHDMEKSQLQTIKDLEESRGWSEWSILKQRLFFAHLANKGLLKPKDFHDVFRVHEKVADYCKYTPPPIDRPKLPSGSDFLDINLDYYGADESFRDFSDLWWKTTQERSEIKDRLLDRLAEVCGTELHEWPTDNFSHSRKIPANRKMYEIFAERRRRELWLVESSFIARLRRI